MQTNNPVLSKYEKADGAGFAYGEGQAAYATATGQAAPPQSPDEQFRTIAAGGGLAITINDVIVKTAMLFVVVLVTAVIGWNLATVSPLVMIVALVVAMAAGFGAALKREVSVPLILVYALAEGLVLGAVSNFYDAYAAASGWNGIVVQAVVATLVTFAVMLALYLTGVVKVTKKFQSIMMVAVVSYLVLGLVSLVTAFFGVGNGFGLYGIGQFGIWIAVIGVLISAFFLMLDFEAIKQGIALGLPERESWRMAFGLLVTLVWIYLEFLRLLALVAGRR